MDIKISKTSRTCQRCEREFVHEEELFSAVRVVEQELQREDYCANCREQAPSRDAYSVWTLKFYDARVAEQAPEESFSPLRQVFYAALESEDRVQRAKAFLAAQLLRRQKVFRLIKESDELETESKVSLFNDRIGNRLVEVRDPHFTYTELDAARQELLRHLQELEAPTVSAEQSNG